jgi:hypothetical protein
MTQTAVATQDQPKAAPMKAGGAMAAFVPQDSTQLLKLADVLSRSGDMIPKGYQNNAPAIAAAMMRGLEVGLAPMQALSSIAVINGRPTMWGDALPALIQRAGHHIDVTYEGTGETLTAVATLTRGDTGKQVVRQFSMADAKRAGLLGKQGPWTQYPQRMLMHRARTWAIRDGASDALMGMQASEEVSDYGPDRARDVTPQEQAPRRGGVVYADPDPVIDDIIEADPSPATATDPDQQSQIDREHAAFLADRDREAACA